MEIFDLYDKNRIPLGKTIERGQRPCEGDFRLIVHLAIIWQDKMLIQKRTKIKKAWPDMWDISVGGCAISGETSSQAIEREVFEELGLKLNFANKTPFMTTYFETGFDDLYVIEQDVNTASLKLQEEEVAEVKWATKDEIKNMMEEGTFLKYFSSEIDYIFEKRTKKDRPFALIKK